MEAAGEVLPLPVPLRDLLNPATCPLALLPWLAWTLSVDTWDATWPEAVKRERIRTAMSIARRKGTAAAVREVVASFGGQIALREWFQSDPPGIPHTFELVLTLNGANGLPAEPAFIDQVIDEVRRAKPLRSHFNFVLGISASGAVGMKAVARPTIYTRLDCIGA